MSLRLGFDIGGTFTDFVVLDDDAGRFYFAKCLTTPKDPSIGVEVGLQALVDEHGLDLGELIQAVHATTLATNVVIERKGTGIALVTTRGFRDVLQIQRQKRYEVYNFYLDKPVPLVDRNSIWEVAERITADGEVYVPLDEDELRRTALEMKARGVRSVAVCFLHAYRNARHERRAQEILNEEVPGMLVSLSSEVSAVYREYERTNTTLTNAYVMPAVREYLRKIDDKLSTRGYRGNLYVMQSNGGIATVETVQRLPVHIIESGPAAGALGASLFGKTAGYEDVISFDMGGTTAKICVIEKGRPGTTNEFEVDRMHLKAGSGLPLNIPAIDLIEIGAGGGSLAQVHMGMITVGPESAGADPGPACYGLGGQEPTVTDANVVLGYLNPEYFLGGKMKLDKESAVRAVRTKLAEPLGIDDTSAAWGIHEIVTTNMARATRVVSIERGKDPRLFSLVAFGGAGPVHAVRLAKIIGIPRVVCPTGAGVASAIGLLVADVKFDLARTLVATLDEAVLEPMRETYAEMERSGLAMLQESKVKGKFVFVRSADMHYVGQGHEIAVTLPPLSYTADDLPALRRAFNEAYAALYGYGDASEAIAVVNWKLSACCVTPRTFAPRDERHVGDVSSASKGARLAYFPEATGFVECDIYDRYRLLPGARLTGPAVIEERESAIVVPPGDVATVDEYNNVVVEVRIDD